MTDPNFTYLVNVIDRSGSMVSIRDDAQGGFNAYLTDQKSQQGRLTVYTAEFDTAHDVVHDHLDGPLVGSYTLEPRGGTALLDAIGYAVTAVGERLAGLPEDQRPGHVICTIVTDGEENSSRKWNRKAVFDLITQQRDQYGWEFIFLAANQDAIATGASIGVAAASSMTFQPTGQSVGSTYGSLSHAVSRTRSGLTKSASFTDEEREAANSPTGGN